MKGTTTAPERAGPLLLYDGECSFCERWVRFILARERKTTLRFASLTGEVGRQLKANFPALEGVDSLVWVEEFPSSSLQSPLVYSDALLGAARYLGGLFGLLVVIRIIPRSLRDSIYRVVARHRHRLAGPSTACEWPPALKRHRWLD